MCGFLGFAGKGSPFNIEQGGARIRRRGPDSLGHWRSADARVQIVHARLAISDLRPAAAQPISDPASGLTLAFVGEIYNHLELREKMAGHEFRTDSDSETLLAVLAEHGVEAALPMLRGMFAIIVVDQRTQRVHLARDPVGKKPLFCLPRPEGIYFGSSVLSLSAASGVTAIDESTAARWWDDGFSPPDKSVLRDCVPLRPGELVTLSWDGEILNKQRITPPKLAPITSISVPEALEEIERLLRQAVRRRLFDNPNPVALLSGGIDSSVICKLAVEEGATRLLTLGSKWFKSPDEKYALEAANRLGVPLEVITLGKDSVCSRVARMVRLQDEPLGVISFIPLANLAQEACRGSRVLLTGDGGDEVFGGYGTPEKWVATGKVDKSKDFHSGPDFPEWMSEYGRRAAGYDQVGHGFAKLDRATAEQALEARCPLLSWDLSAFVRAMPKEVFFYKPVAKPLLKGLLKDWPETFLERKKAGFTFRMRWFWLASNYEGIRETIRPEIQELFKKHLPPELRSPAKSWGTLTIFHHFDTVFRLYVWSAYLNRLEEPPDADHSTGAYAIASRFPSASHLAELKAARFSGTKDDAQVELEALSSIGCDPANTSVLDYNCGWGARAYQLMAEGYRVTGFETDRESAAFAVSQMGVAVYQNEKDIKSQADVLICTGGLPATVNSVKQGGWLVIRDCSESATVIAASLPERKFFHGSSPQLLRDWAANPTASFVEGGQAKVCVIKL